MTGAIMAVIGTTEIVLIVLASAFFLGVPVVAGVILWKLVRAEQDRRRGLR